MKLLLKIFATTSLMVAWTFSSTAQAIVTPSKQSCEKWITKAFTRGKVPPFSFVYDGRPSAEQIGKWRYTVQILPEKEGVTERVYTYTDPKTGLEVTCNVKTFKGFDAMEWVLHFRNTSRANTPKIEQLKVVDLTARTAKKESCTLYYAKGSQASREDFHTHSLALEAGAPRHVMAPTGGRSSQEAFPFFNVATPEGGMVVAVGWTGNWQAEVGRGDEQSFTVTTGMKTLSTYLLPSEVIRTPSTAMILWRGDDRMIGQNQLRRFLMSYHHPKQDGHAAKYPICSSFNYGDPSPCNEYSCMTTDYALALIRRYAQFDLVPETFWLDAGWYSKASDWRNQRNWANTVGNWSVDTVRFPKGLGEIADEVHRVGAEFLVWFEPERVMKDSDWAMRHPEFMLDASGKAAQPGWIKHGDTDSYLFNLGDSTALRWFCATIARLIRDNRIDHYRQDFNIEPEGFWAANDQPDRQGICEIRYITGLYAFWDYLHAEFPHLLIDNCASGGRRIDLETTSRSAPLWRTDYNYGEPNGYQCHTYGLNQWLAVHGTGTHQSDPFTFRSSLGATVIFNWKITNAQSSIFEMQQRKAEFEAVQPYFLEDFYPLTGDGDCTGDDIWIAYQLLRPTDQTGYVVAFRRDKCPSDVQTIRFRGLDPKAQYVIENCDNTDCVELSGSSLIQGFDLGLGAPHSSLLLKYHKK